MDEDERRDMRQAILEDLAPLFESRLASAEWGRALVTMIPRDNGTFRVASIDVEDVVGDEALIEAALGAPEMRDVLPVVERATETLITTYDLEVAALDGGTYLRREDGSLGFLPGLVHAPSASFSRETAPALEFLTRSRQEVARLVDDATRFDVDLEGGALRFLRGDQPVVTARLVVLGSFARAARSFTWAWQNPSLSEPVQAAARALCDEVPFRDMWELTTPQFASDEGTVWTLGSIVARATGLAALQDVQRADGFVLLGLRDLSPVV